MKQPSLCFHHLLGGGGQIYMRSWIEIGGEVLMHAVAEFAHKNFYACGNFLVLHGIDRLVSET